MMVDSTSASALGRALTLVTPPALRPVTLDQVKDHLRVELADTDEDALIDGLIDQAIGDLDGSGGWLGRALITQSWTLKLGRFPQLATQAIRMPLPPLQAVTQIQYVDTDYQTQIWDPANYQVDAASRVGKVMPASGVSWPATPTDIFHPVTIAFDAGYGGNPDDVPDAIISGLLLTVGNYYANRDDVVVGTIASRLPITVEKRLYRFRAWGFR